MEDSLMWQPYPPLPHHQYNGSSLAHFNYCMLPNCWSMHESSPQWKMQVLNTTTCTLGKHFACLLLELCPHALESISILVQCMGLNIGAVLWACVNVQQNKQFHMIDRNVSVLSCIVRAIL